MDESLFRTAMMNRLLKNPTPRCLFQSDHTYFYIDKFGQCSYLHGFAGRKIAIEILAIHFIDGSKLVHIGNENGGFNHIIETCFRFFQDRFQVFHRLLCFILDAFILQFACNGIQTYLPGNVQGLSYQHGLAIRANWRGCFVGPDDYFIHNAAPQNWFNEYTFMPFLCKKLSMNVLVLANEEQQEELLALPVNDVTRIQWIRTTADHRADQSFDACIDLLFDNNRERIDWLKHLQLPLIVVNSVDMPLREIQEDFIRINGWNTFLKRIVMEASGGPVSLKTRAEELFGRLGRKTEWVADMTGFITPRVVASIINEAFFALEEKVSTAEEIDIAMKTGTNYPYGPFEWSRRIGLRRVYSLLVALSREQSRYQPSTLLKQAVLA